MFTMIDDKVINISLVKFFYVDSSYGIHSLKFVFNDIDGGKREIIDFADFETREKALAFFEVLAKDVCDGKIKAKYSTK
ncbi:MAG: hypothetical protein IKP49_00435 [Treponema sp.]|nr:hypothetical protein [Treponema sp.]